MCTNFNILALVLGMEMHVLDSYICSHDVSKDFWMLLINEELVCAQESGNTHDPYAVRFD